MDDRFDDKPLKAEVIDMDRARKARNRPSAVYSERVDSAVGSGPADPGFRYLFEDNGDGHPRRGSKSFGNFRGLILTAAFAMTSAWVVWNVPGFGPHEHQAQITQRLAASELKMDDLESRLAQAQARVIELTRTVEIQNALIDQAESLRRSMTTSLENLTENARRMAEGQAVAANRIEKVESGLSAQKTALRNQEESIAGLDSALIEGLGRVQLSHENLDRSVRAFRQESEAARLEAIAEFGRLVRKEVAALREDDLKSVRERVERLAEHVWDEVGRLDGRIVRTAEVPAESRIRR